MKPYEFKTQKGNEARLTAFKDEISHLVITVTVFSGEATRAYSVVYEGRDVLAIKRGTLRPAAFIRRVADYLERTMPLP